MGCDIHMYVEYQRKDTDRPKYWSSFGSRINPGRDYDLFGKLASVRGGTALIEPRGLPEHITFWTEHDSQIYITEDKNILNIIQENFVRSKVLAHGAARYMSGKVY
ncbi:MAG: hypothetical protein ACRDFB_09020 [Rhabdochlamydiaceae bacterium]